MLDRLTVEDFTPVVGETFTIALDGLDPLALTLVDAFTHDPQAPPVDGAGHRSPFTLRFDGPSEPSLPQRIYRLEHEAREPLEIFIVPFGRDEAATHYEAIFT